MSFIRFPFLPLEIRLYIWSFTLDAIEPRVVRANCLKAIEHSGTKNNPILLFVNRESRDKTLQRYKLASSKDNTYIQFEKDTLFVDGYFGLRDTLWTDPNIRNLALDINFAEMRKKTLYEKIKQFPELRKLILVPNPYWHQGLLSAVTNIIFEDMRVEKFSKFPPSQVDFVGNTETYIKQCYGDRPRLQVHVAEIFFIRDGYRSQHNDSEVEEAVAQLVDTR